MASVCRKRGPDQISGADSGYAPVSETRSLLHLSKPQARGRLRASVMAAVMEACVLASLTPDAVNRRVRDGRLLGLTGAERGLRLPKWQFCEPMNSAMPKLTSGLRTLDPWSVLALLESPHAALGGRPPRAAIEQGELECVVPFAASE